MVPAPLSSRRAVQRRVRRDLGPITKGMKGGLPLQVTEDTPREREARLEELFRVGSDAVGAPPVTRDDVFYTFNDNLRSKNRSKEVEFRDAKPLASGCRRTDRAVVLNEEEGALPSTFDLGHVPFLRSDTSQLLKLLL